MNHYKRVDTIPLAIPVTGSKPPKPLTASDERPPVPLNCPSVGRTLCAECGWFFGSCWARGRTGRVAGLGAKAPGLRTD